MTVRGHNRKIKCVSVYHNIMNWFYNVKEKSMSVVYGSTETNWSVVLVKGITHSSSPVNQVRLLIESLIISPWFGSVLDSYKKKKKARAGEKCTVLHGCSSWLFIRRCGRQCRRWMFLRTSEGMHSTCRFSAAVSWMLLLKELGSTIFSRSLLEMSSVEVVCFHTHLCPNSSVISVVWCWDKKIHIFNNRWQNYLQKMLFLMFYSNLVLVFGMLVLVPDTEHVLIPSRHCAIDLQGPDWRGVRSGVTDRWFIWVNLSLTGGKTGGGGGYRRNEAPSTLNYKHSGWMLDSCSGLSLQSDSQMLAQTASSINIVRCC